MRQQLLFCVFLFAFRAGAGLHAQQVADPLPGVPRVTQFVDSAQRTPLRGNVHPLGRQQFDQGEAPAELPLGRILMVLKRSPEQDAALSRLLEEQQDIHSAAYHQWLTPQQFGERFGPAQADVDAVTQWLISSGFQIA